MVLYLSQDEVKQVLNMKTTIDVVENGFKEMGLGRVEMPTRIYLHFEKYNGVLITMPAYIEALDAAGVKVVTVHPNNPSKHGLPSVIARIILNDPKQGSPIAIMDGTYITMLRTGAAGAIGIKYLSRKDSENAAIIGLGVQGRSQLLGLREVRNIKKVRVFDALPEARNEYVKTMSKETQLEIKPADSVQEAVKGADIVITCTPSKEAFLKGDMLRAGTHVSAIGADTKDKRELDTSVLLRANKIVVDSADQAAIVGDFAIPIGEGAFTKEKMYAELCEVVAGRKKGRTNREEITVFKATGLAMEDIVTAHRVYQLAKEKGIGREI
ncbi:NAD(P)-binding domain-containing protein [Candidatus Bathyarchaeota archaeon]|nr:NAD(P)-binding domain-containing protein [Candidatus Bathyarchaeota archaeon]